MTSKYRLEDIEREHPRPWQLGFDLTEDDSGWVDIWIKDANGVVVTSVIWLLDEVGEQKMLRLVPFLIDAVNAYENPVSVRRKRKRRPRSRKRKAVHPKPAIGQLWRRPNGSVFKVVWMDDRHVKVQTIQAPMSTPDRPMKSSYTLRSRFGTTYRCQYLGDDG